MTDSIDAFRHECEFCDETLEASTLDAVQETGRTHLKTQHRDEFQTVFVDRVAGRPCLNGCGHSFPRNPDPDNDIGFACQNCDHDHFSEIADRYIWWRVEAE